jgi:hypothetical protein
MAHGDGEIHEELVNLGVRPRRAVRLSVEPREGSVDLTAVLVEQRQTPDNLIAAF